MKDRITKLCAFLLALVLLMGIVAGCSPQSGNESSVSSESDNA